MLRLWARRLGIFLLVMAIVFMVGIYRLNSLNTTPIKSSNFSWINKSEIYILGLVSSAFAYPIYPELVREHLMMYSGFDEDPKVINDDFFLRSKVVQKAINSSKAIDQPVRLVWPTSSYPISFDYDKYWEARTALALNGGYIRIKGNRAIVRVKITYPRKSFAPLFEIPGIGMIGIEEGLFWLLQQEGWLASGHVEWQAPLTH